MKSQTELALAIGARNFALANDQSLLYPAFDKNPNAAHGVVLAANDANFEAEHLSEALTEYIVGAPEDEGLLAKLDEIAPAIPVGRAFTYRTHDTREQFQDDSDDDGDIREIGGEFAKIRRTGAQADGRTDNKGLVMVLDNDQGGQNDSVQKRAILNLRSRLVRSDLRRVMAIIEANATNTGSNWGPSGTPDPDSEILDDVDAGGDARGVDSNLVIYGGGAFIKRKKAYRYHFKAGDGFSTAKMSPAEMAADAGVDRLVVVKNRRQSSAAAKAKILGDIVYSLYSRSGAMPDDPSNIKRFVTPAGGQDFRVFITTETKRTLVCVEHYSRVVLASPLGIRKRTVTYT